MTGNCDDPCMRVDPGPGKPLYCERMHSTRPTVPPEGPMRPISFDLRLRATAHQAVPAEGVGPLPCPSCGSGLEFHQPDPDAERLLATCGCEEGGAWFIPVPGPCGRAARL